MYFFFILNHTSICIYTNFHSVGRRTGKLPALSVELCGKRWFCLETKRLWLVGVLHLLPLWLQKPVILYYRRESGRRTSSRQSSMKEISLKQAPFQALPAWFFCSYSEQPRQSSICKQQHSVSGKGWGKSDLDSDASASPCLPKNKEVEIICHTTVYWRKFFLSVWA